MLNSIRSAHFERFRIFAATCLILRFFTRQLLSNDEKKDKIIALLFLIRYRIWHELSNPVAVATA